VKGFPEVLSDIQFLIKKTYPKAVEILQKGGEGIAADGQANAPVKTGHLRDSIKSTPVPDGAIVTAGGGVVDYAIFQEEGTTKMTGRAFMGRAASDWLDRIDQQIEEGLPD
jgi:HK97 gp10 family phage protein